MIPNEAMKKENLWKVKSNLEKHRLSSRKYPDVKIGDMFFVLYRKRKNFEKEGQSIWTEKKHEVMRIEDIPHCLLYTSPSPRDLSTSRMPSSA